MENQVPGLTIDVGVGQPYHWNLISWDYTLKVVRRSSHKV